MRKLFLMAAAAAMVLFTASCSKENNGTGKETTQLSIKISGVIASRAVEAPGSTAVGTIQLTNGQIFVINPMGAVTYSEVLNVSQATGAGQTLSSQVAADSRVFIVGNIPAGETGAVAALANFAAIEAYTSLMTTQSNYREAALSNSDGQPAAIGTPVSGVSSVSVSIKPLISRIELVQVRGGANITAFTVTGVYADDYYPSFTYAGGFSGTMFSQNQNTTFAGIGDPGSWAAASSPLIAAPASPNVWAHNVASGGVTRLIIVLEGVQYNDSGALVDLTGTTYYLTVSGYNNLGSTVFERGKIYRIGGANGITFNPDDLGLVPNPVDIDLIVNVLVEEWVLVTPDPIL
jgi:hypothetical protein